MFSLAVHATFMANVHQSPSKFRQRVNASTLALLVLKLELLWSTENFMSYGQSGE